MHIKGNMWGEGMRTLEGSCHVGSLSSRTFAGGRGDRPRNGFEQTKTAQDKKKGGNVPSRSTTKKTHKEDSIGCEIGQPLITRVGDRIRGGGATDLSTKSNRVHDGGKNCSPAKLFTLTWGNKHQPHCGAHQPETHEENKAHLRDAPAYPDGRPENPRSGTTKKSVERRRERPRSQKAPEDPGDHEGKNDDGENEEGV